jgi:predicted 3-demethylubiquinone-9 3-methyltransferase (glyoxalase superfamily)
MPAPPALQRHPVSPEPPHPRSLDAHVSANEEVPVAELSFIQACLWFNDQARDAMEYYVDVFPNSRILSIEEYPDESLDEHFVGMTGKVLGRPEQVQVMMQQKKIVIAELENA